MAIDPQQLNALFSSFKTPPFLFAGSGLARRYFATPDWEGLLREFANDISGNEFGYPAYRGKCSLRSDDDMFLPTRQVPAR